MTTTIKGCQRDGKFFLKKEAAIIDQVQPDELKKQIIEIWPTTEERKISDSELKSLVSLKTTHDPSFREFIKSIVNGESKNNDEIIKFIISLEKDVIQENYEDLLLKISKFKTKYKIKL